MKQGLYIDLDLEELIYQESPKIGPFFIPLAKVSWYKLYTMSTQSWYLGRRDRVSCVFYYSKKDLIWPCFEGFLGGKVFLWSIVANLCLCFGYFYAITSANVVHMTWNFQRNHWRMFALVAPFQRALFQNRFK